MKIWIIAPLFLFAFQSSWAAGLTSLLNHVPTKKIARSIDMGRRSASDKMQFAITLLPKDQAGLADFANRVNDPSDPLFHQFLTAEQFTERFAPSQQDIDEVIQNLQAQGLTVVRSHPNRMVVDVSGSVSEIENAFQVELHSFIAPDGRIVSSITSDPIVSDTIAARVNSIVGLNSFTKRKRFLKRATQVPHSGMTFQQASAYMTPAKIKSVYNLSSLTQTGSGETLALFELDGYTASDISSYATAFSITAPTLQNVCVGCTSFTPGDGADEVTLDIEMAMAVAPGLSKIMVYESPPQTDTMTQQQADAEVIDIYNQIASDDLAKTVSTSWGAAENETDSTVFNSEYTTFLEMSTQGQSMFAAAGDSGAYDDSVNDVNTSLEVDDPCSQPYVTCTGGTTLTLNGTNYGSETSWRATAATGTYDPSNPDSNYTPAEGGGGGISKQWASSYVSSWQTAGLATTANKGSSSMRMVPDVSLDADPNTGYAVYYGGTGLSLAEPVAPLLFGPRIPRWSIRPESQAL